MNQAEGWTGLVKKFFKYLPESIFMEGNVMNRLFLIIYLGVMTAMAPLSTDMYLPCAP